MKTKLIAPLILSLSLSLLFLGCGPNSESGGKKDPEAYRPAPSSSLTYNEAFLYAMFLTNFSPSKELGLGVIAPTGSMLPILDSSSVVVTEKVGAETVLRKNDLVIFNRGDEPRVLHRIIDVRKDSYFISGDNNSGSDGWFPKSAIQSRVVAIIFSSQREGARQ